MMNSRTKMRVQRVVKFGNKSSRTGKTTLSGSERGSNFFFGARRYGSFGVRRLFLAQKCFISPAYEPDWERPRGIMRMVSSPS
jgi:hypothetical protein